MSNRKTGTTFERELCQILAAHGFWAHNLAQNAAGQPFDVLAAKDGRAYPIDCKVCEHDKFPLSRIEENQESSMLLWQDTGNEQGWFAMKLSDGTIRMWNITKLLWFRDDKGMKELDKLHLETFGLSLERWFEYADNG